MAVSNSNPIPTKSDLEIQKSNALAVEKKKADYASELESLKHKNNLELEKHKLIKSIWDKAIDTQMHFNEMSVKSRQLGMSFVVAALGLSVVLLSKPEALISLPIPCFTAFKLSCPAHLQTHVSAVILLISAVALQAVRILDLNVYHRMLRGAVAFGEDLEASYLRKDLITTKLGMTELVSLYSRNTSIERQSDGSYKSTKPVTASIKIGNFYNTVIIILLALSLILAVLFFKVT